MVNVKLITVKNLENLDVFNALHIFTILNKAFVLHIKLVAEHTNMVFVLIVYQTLYIIMEYAKFKDVQFNKVMFAKLVLLDINYNQMVFVKFQTAYNQFKTDV
jgi:hypothetical protein